MVCERTGRAERPVHHDLPQAFDRLVRVRGDEHALATCEPARLEHDVVPARLDVVDRLVDRVRAERAERRRGDLVPRHEGLGEGLRALHPRSLRGRAKHGDTN
jgi:hypothetical protein